MSYYDDGVIENVLSFLYGRFEYNIPETS